ncbi:hypothetical protein [Cohaesibacter sp. ES.047]|uniref:hypothetical protein n=1 Tax=Cohaesibacter sp. ES.047 TaxID=1798205 RepID=UPI000BB7BA61|nr:hypothetical protein [Cohaesibacter sp. ES.047]
MLYALMISLFAHGTANADEATGEIRIVRQGEQLIVKDVFTAKAAGIYKTSLQVSKNGLSGQISSSQNRQMQAKAGEICEGNRIAMKVQTGDQVEVELIIQFEGTEFVHTERTLKIQTDGLKPSLYETNDKSIRL